VEIAHKGTFMLDKLAHIEQRYEELRHLLADPAVLADPAKLRAYAQEQAKLEELVQTFREYKATAQALESTRLMLDDADAEMRALAKEELAQLEAREAKLSAELKRLLLPKDPRDEKSVIVEIRAGTGGDEAGLFAADLYRMYTRYAESRGWGVDFISANESGIGGFKEVIFEIRGQGAYSRLKYEAGVHRVQRIPQTEASGRIHTSTATVAVLPKVDEVEVQIDPKDLRVDVYHASGHGGQNVQKVATAIRVTHLPTGIVVACQDERSQAQNRLRAMSVLRARLYEMQQEKIQNQVTESRRAQVGTGERAEKIRTYNFPQSRVTDHRIGFTSHRLQQFLDGALDELIDQLAMADQAEKLKAVGVTDA